MDREYGNRYSEQELRETANRLANPAWVRLRESLIPKAEKEAYRTVGYEPTGKKERIVWTARWNRTFHSEMDRMAAASWRG
jgi:hypothetical protein